MKYSIRKKVIKYYNSKNELLRILIKCEQNKEISLENRTLITGLSNEVWQNWIQIFRTLWLTYYYGGETLFGQVSENEYGISNFLNTDTEAIAIMKITRANRITSFYNEKNWGSNKELGRIAAFYPMLNRANVIASSVSLYGEYVNDFQMIRNNMIHLTKDGFLELKDRTTSRNYNTPVKYYPHNHPINFFYCKIGVSTNYAYEEIFEQLDQMIDTIFLYNPDL